MGNPPAASVYCIATKWGFMVTPQLQALSKRYVLSLNLKAERMSISQIQTGSWLYRIVAWKQKALSPILVFLFIDVICRI